MRFTYYKQRFLLQETILIYIFLFKHYTVDSKILLLLTLPSQNFKISLNTPKRSVNAIIPIDTQPRRLMDFEF